MVIPSSYPYSYSYSYSDPGRFLMTHLRWPAGAVKGSGTSSLDLVSAILGTARFAVIDPLTSPRTGRRYPVSADTTIAIASSFVTASRMACHQM